jgi:hypothetical protein
MVQLQGRVYFESASKVKLILFAFAMSGTIVIQMNFEGAMYNCLIRRMELVAFDMAEELHEYWTQSDYYPRALKIGIP